MAFYEWQDSFSVGSKTMDEQHKKMIGILNQLHDAMKTGKAAKEINIIVNEMSDYTKFHFSSEEKLMTDSQYIGLAGQKAEHAAFIKKSQEFQESIHSGKLAVRLDVLNFLKGWWTNHILVTDMKYSGKLKG
jgi:hemerythrin